MSKVLVDRELLGGAAALLAYHSRTSWDAEAYTAKDFRKLIAQPAEAEGVDRQRMIESMCLTWRHDFGLDKPADCQLSSGMTDTERNQLRDQMGKLFDHHFAPALSAVTAERDRLREENKRLDLMVSEADFNYDQDRDRMAGLLRNAMISLEQWNLKHPRLAKRGEEYSSEHTYRQIRAFLPEYREFDAAMAAKEA